MRSGGGWAIEHKVDMTFLSTSPALGSLKPKNTVKHAKNSDTVVVSRGSDRGNNRGIIYTSHYS